MHNAAKLILICIICIAIASAIAFVADRMI
jgi:hypothetical protein